MRGSTRLGRTEMSGARCRGRATTLGHLVTSRSLRSRRSTGPMIVHSITPFGPRSSAANYGRMLPWKHSFRSCALRCCPARP